MRPACSARLPACDRSAHAKQIPERGLTAPHVVFGAEGKVKVAAAAGYFCQVIMARSPGTRAPSLKGTIRAVKSSGGREAGTVPPKM